MDSSSVQRFFRWQAPIYDLTRWAVLHGRHEAVEALSLRPGDRVLEIGCGTGLNFTLLRDAVSETGQVTGADFSPEMLERAFERCVRRGWRNVSLQQADATTLTSDQRFAGALFSYSLSMIRDWRAALRRALDLLVPGGRLVVLDFGRFEQWLLPTAWLIRAWLRANHVDTSPSYAEAVVQLTERSKVESRLGGYYFLASGTKAGGQR